MPVLKAILGFMTIATSIIFGLLIRQVISDIGINRFLRMIFYIIISLPICYFLGDSILQLMK